MNPVPNPNSGNILTNTERADASRDALRAILRPVLWVSSFSLLSRELLVRLLPPLPSLAWDLWLSVSTVSFAYLWWLDQRNSSGSKRVSNSLSLLLQSQLYGGSCLLLLFLLFPQAQADFWVSLIVVPLGSLLAAVLLNYWARWTPLLFGASSEQNEPPRGGTMLPIQSPPSVVLTSAPLS